MKWDRLWIFFVIVAVGLALSWGKVGQKTEQTISQDPFELLRAEPGCLLPRDSCAAYGSELALVAKGGWLPDERMALYFKLVGAEMAAISHFEAEVRVDGRAPEQLAVLRRQDDWQTVYAGSVPVNGRLRIRFETATGRYATEYTLTPGAGQ